MTTAEAERPFRVNVRLGWAVVNDVLLGNSNFEADATVKLTSSCMAGAGLGVATNVVVSVRPTYTNGGRDQAMFPISRISISADVCTALLYSPLVEETAVTAATATNPMASPWKDTVTEGCRPLRTIDETAQDSSIELVSVMVIRSLERVGRVLRAKVTVPEPSTGT